MTSVRELGPTGVQKRTALYAQSRSGGNRAGKGGKAISLMSCKTWERREEGADMRLEETNLKGDSDPPLFVVKSSLLVTDVLALSRSKYIAR